MKFLKKDFTEAGYVIGVVQHAALSHPEIAFSMVRDGKQVFSSAGDGKLMTPVFGVFGREITANMIEINPFERDAVTVWGYVTKPHCCRPNRSMQHFFVNGRYIKSKLLQAAVEEAFQQQNYYWQVSQLCTIPAAAAESGRCQCASGKDGSQICT